MSMQVQAWLHRNITTKDTLTQLLPQSSFLLFTCLLECIGTLEELGLG